ncbi:MAG: FHA domain-containing protein [Planctomycetota bacterium]
MAKLVVVSGELRGTEFRLASEQTIGRLADNDIPIAEATISRRHARVFRAADGWRIEDAGSSTGIRIDDQPVVDANLEDGARFRLGDVEIMFLDDDGTGPAVAPVPRARPAADDGIGRTGEFGANDISVRARSASGSRPSVSGDRHLAFSENVGKKASLLGRDVSQEGGLGRWVLIAAVIAFAVGLFWVTQQLVAGG